MSKYLDLITGKGLAHVKDLSGTLLVSPPNQPKAGSVSSGSSDAAEF